MEQIYVRRQLAAGIIVIATFLVGGAFLLNSEPQVVEMVQVTVQPNDTLWSLAEEYAPNTDPRDWIYEVNEMNTILGTLKPGQILTVPVIEE